MRVTEYKKAKDRLLSKAIVKDDCWGWKAATTSGGYASMKWTQGNAVHWKAHRISYLLFKGPLKPGMVIDHSCHNKKCVNPNHLRQVTQRFNVIDNSRGGTARLNSLKTKCPKGHEYTYWENIKRRVCKQCRKIHNTKRAKK